MTATFTVPQVTHTGHGGGGLYVVGGSTVVMRNCTFWLNSAGTNWDRPRLKRGYLSPYMAAGGGAM